MLFCVNNTMLFLIRISSVIIAPLVAGGVGIAIVV